jgi:hypothetical protein
LNPTNDHGPLSEAVHLAQINVARGLFPLDHPAMADFVTLLDVVNGVADADSGLVWRLKTESGGPSSYVKVPGDERMLINLTVWRSIDSLKNYVYRSHEHAGAFRDRKRWFEEPAEASFALWWVAAGDIPSVEEGFERLNMLRRLGPTSEAFTFKVTFPVARDAASRVVIPVWRSVPCGAR